MTFGALYVSTYDRVYGYAWRRVLNHAAAEDVASETYLRALAAYERYQDRGQALAWLYRIAANVVIDRARHERWCEPTDQVADVADPVRVEDEVERRDQLQRIWAAAAGLTDGQRRALTLYFAEERSHAEIAEALGKSEGAVRVLVHRGVAALREVA